MVARYPAMLLLIQVSACAGVDIVRLTNATCSAKPSVEDIVVLNQAPDPPHARLVELHMEDLSVSFARMR
jgi:hypothetical protein